jgi:hypothetical protein
LNYAEINRLGIGSKVHKAGLLAMSAFMAATYAASSPARDAERQAVANELDQLCEYEVFDAVDARKFSERKSLKQLTPSCC